MLRTESLGEQIGGNMKKDNIRKASGIIASLLFLILNISLSSDAADVAAVNNKDFGPSQILRPTSYYTKTVDMDAANCPVAHRRSILNGKGQVLAKLCPQDWNECQLQGVCILSSKASSQLINYTSGGRFEIVDQGQCPWGRGVQTACLDPFYTVATNLSNYPYGTVIYVPALKDVILPNGKPHGGYLIVRDTGGAFPASRPDRMDFFTGNLFWLDPNNPFSQAGFADPNKKFSFQVVRGETAKAVREARGFPFLKSSK